MIINNYFRNLLLSSSPGVISVVLSFFSIPIYLKYLGLEIYGNFIILHILLSIVMITNLNLGKVASIKMQKVSLKKRNSIISTTIFISFITSVLVSLLLYLIYFVISEYNSNFILPNYKLFFFTLFISNIYVTLEFICKGIKYFYLSSVTNLIFYSFSLSVPALFLILDQNYYGNVNQLFKISILFKILSILIILIILFYKKILDFIFLPSLIIKDFINYAKWQTLSSAYIQIFDFFDKYLIKIFLGASSLALYSIPQQITSKLSVVSDALISVFIPRISSNNKYKKIVNIFNSNFYGFFYLSGIFIIIIIPFSDIIFYWWLGDVSNNKIIFLFKIFLLVSFYVCIIHIISTFIDTQYLSKKNSQIETIILILFCFGLIISIYSKNIDYFAYTILVRVLVTFILKAFYIKKYFINFKILIIQNLILVTSTLFNVIEKYLLFYSLSLIFLLAMTIYFPWKIFKKEFLK